MRQESFRRLWWMWLLMFLCGPVTAQQMNLGPNQTQFRGVLQPANGGSGLLITNQTGALCFTAGMPFIGACGGGSGGVATITIATANGFQGTSSGGSAPQLTIQVDASHFLPVNNGSASLFLTQAGTYVAAGGAPGVLSQVCTGTCTFAASGVTAFSTTLSGSVTSSTLTGAVAGQHYTFTWTQPGGGGDTCAYPAGTVGANACSPTASAHTQQTFYNNGTNLIADGPAKIY